MLSRIRSLRLAALLTASALALAGPIVLSIATAGPTPYPGGITLPVSVANGGTGATTKSFVDLTTTQNVAGAKTFTTSPLTIASTLASTSGTNLTLRGTGSNVGILINTNGADLVDFGVTGPGVVALLANTSIGGYPGTGALSLGAMSGDTSLPTGNFSWTGATGKSFSVVAGTDSTFSTTSGALNLNAAGAINIGATSTSVNLAASGLVTAILGNVTMATTKTLVVGANTLISSDKIVATQLTGSIPVANGGTGGTSIATALAGLGIRAGTITLVNGTATVTDAATTASTRVILTPTTINAGAGSLTIQYSHFTNSAGSSFGVRANIAAGSINTLDTSVLDYIAIN